LVNDRLEHQIESLKADIIVYEKLCREHFDAYSYVENQITLLKKKIQSIHKQTERPGFEHGYCMHCQVPYPCVTIRALDEVDEVATNQDNEEAICDNCDQDIKCLDGIWRHKDTSFRNCPITTAMPKQRGVKTLVQSD